LIRSIVLSRVYRLSSAHQADNYAADPSNKFLWRMERRRLDAEEIRDAMLAASGAIDLKRPDGSPVLSYRAASVCQANVAISQNWVVSHASWNKGRNDGFVTAKGIDSMAYFTEEDLPFYYSLARTFPLCDRWFASTMAQTDPNRRFLMAGSAFGLVDDSFPAAAAHSYRPEGFGTVFEMLDHYGISWRNYYSSLPSSLLFPYLASSNAANLKRMTQFFADAAAGALPGFCLVDPDFEKSSEENPQDIQNGEAFAASVVDAVLHSPAWPQTVLVFLYDEHGGYYDTPPPAARPPRRHVARRPRGPGRRVPGQLDRRPGPGRHRVAVVEEGLRLPRRPRPHLGPEAPRDEVEPARPVPPRRQRQQPPRLPRPHGQAAPLPDPARPHRGRARERRRRVRLRRPQPSEPLTGCP
jgi:hypothetical protein